MRGYNFTQRVRRVLAVAHERARELNHEYIGTEHLLLGLVRDDNGVGVAVLRNLGARVDDIEQRVLDTVEKGHGRSGTELPYTSRAKKVLELAMSEAAQLNHAYVGTEHLLLGLLAEGHGIAVQVLQSFGVMLEQARAETLRLLGMMAPARDLGISHDPQPHEGERPSHIQVVLRYDNGAVRRASFDTAGEAVAYIRQYDAER